MRPNLSMISTLPARAGRPLARADAFAVAFTGAHHAATSPWNSTAPPSEEQAKAGDYRMGVVDWRGLQLLIENPVHTAREGIGEDGKPWRSTMMAHYGFIAGTHGADGDEVDVFLGPAPESRAAWVLNQTDASGGFDEHKVLVGFVDARQAVDAYRFSYAAGWDRFGVPIPVSLDQLRWWLKFGDTTRPFTIDQVPPEHDMTEATTSAPSLTRVFWDAAAMPTSGQSLGDVLYGIRQTDTADGLLLEGMTMADIVEGAEVVHLDALVTEAGKLKPKMTALLRIMEAAGQSVKPVAMQLSDLLRRFGGVHVAALFELSDGQTITAWFHNPDMTPAKFTPVDSLVSWKWQLNKKDVTIVVAPESGQDLNLREVARRLMRLAEKNSAAFIKANVKRAATMAEIEGLRTTLSDRQGTLQRLMGQIEVAKVEVSDKQAATDRDPVLVHAQAVRRALLALGWTAVGDRMTLAFEGASIWLVSSSGGAGTMFSLTRLVSGVLDGDEEVSDDIAADPAVQAKRLDDLAKSPTLRAEVPLPIAPDIAVTAEEAFLRDIARGAHDALALNDMLDQIAVAVRKLSAGGLLTGAVDAHASDAITHWATLEETANG